MENLKKFYPVSCVKAGNGTLAKMKEELADILDCDPGDVEVQQNEEGFQVFVSSDKVGNLKKEGNYLVAFEPGELPYSFMSF